MQAHQITEMTNVILAACKHGRPTRRQVEKALTDYWSGRMAIVWDADDMHCAANRAGRVLTASEAGELLHRVCHKHDASVGVTWETLELYASDAGRPLTPEEKAKHEADEDACIIAQS